MRDETRRLQDILEAIAKIEERTRDIDESDFRTDEMLQVWVVHHLQIIGEASRSLSDEFKDDHPTVPWSEIEGMRHYLVHEYFRIDLDIAWSTVQKDLQPLKEKLCEISEDD